VSEIVRIYDIRLLVVDRLRRMRPSLGCHEPNPLAGELANGMRPQVCRLKRRSQHCGARCIVEPAMGALDHSDRDRLYPSDGIVSITNSTITVPVSPAEWSTAGYFGAG
jgi:hypothetical protein